jgi:hypothetical protein
MPGAAVATATALEDAAAADAVACAGSGEVGSWPCGWVTPTRQPCNCSSTNEMNLHDHETRRQARQHTGNIGISPSNISPSHTCWTDFSNGEAQVKSSISNISPSPTAGADAPTATTFDDAVCDRSDDDEVDDAFFPCDAG